MNKAISTTIILLLLTGSITVGLVTYKVYQTYQTTQTVSTSIECINKRLDYCTYWRNVNYASEPYWDQNCGDKPTIDVCNNLLKSGATTSESTTPTTSTTTTTIEEVALFNMKLNELYYDDNTYINYFMSRGLTEEEAKEQLKLLKDNATLAQQKIEPVKKNLENSIKNAFGMHHSVVSSQ